MALIQRKESEDNMTCQGFTVKSMLKNAKVKTICAKNKFILKFK